MEERLTPDQLEAIKAQDDDYVVNRLILVHMCMCLCMNLMNEVVERLKAQSRFRYGLKNTLKNVRREIKEMMGQFFNRIDADATDEYVENYIVFEETLRVMARLKDYDPERVTRPRVTQFNEWWYQETKHTLPPTTSDIIDWADRN